MKKLIDACKALVQAYKNGEESGGSVDWQDLDDAHELAKAALEDPQVHLATISYRENSPATIAAQSAEALTDLLFDYVMEDWVEIMRRPVEGANADKNTAIDDYFEQQGLHEREWLDTDIVNIEVTDD